MTFHYYDIIIRPLDPEIEIDFDAHGFLLFLVHFACVHFTLLYKALEGRCGMADFWKYDFQKSNFSVVNFGLIQKVANETLVNLMVLNKFSLCCMGLRTIFREITFKTRNIHVA